MRPRPAAVLAALLALAGCASPADLGITGPGQATVHRPTAPVADDAALTALGVAPQSGNTYAPDLVPNYGAGGRYYGY